MSTPDPKFFWRVTPPGARKTHLTSYEQGKGSGLVALCGTPISQDKRLRAPSEKISTPRGNECQACLRWAGFITEKVKRLPKTKSLKDQRMDAFIAFIKMIGKYKQMDVKVRDNAILAAWQMIHNPPSL